MPDAHKDVIPGGVHAIAAAGYSSGADTYEAGRPGYPPVVLDWLRDMAGVDAGRSVLEVGAGTGAFTARLTATAARVCAVEPVEAMRLKLARRAPGALIVAGSAEALPLRDASMDAVVCAQSFHWFATGQALQEFERVLVPGGTLALVWNVRDASLPWVNRLLAMTDAYTGEAPRYANGEWRRAFEGSRFVEVDRRDASHVHTGPVERVVMARALSVSFVAALPAEERRALEERLRRFIAGEPALAGQGDVAFPYRTTMYAYRLVPG
jgi:SAM-dependent methyltransferase